MKIKDNGQINENISLFVGNCRVYNKYWVRDGYIAPDILSGEKDYDPFVYYLVSEDTNINKKAKEPIITGDIVEDILGKRVKDLQLHTLFASLENEDQVIKWAYHFGLPYNKMPKKDPWFPQEKEVVITDLFTLDELIKDYNYTIGGLQLKLLTLGNEKEPIEEEIEYWNKEVKPIKLSKISEEVKELKVIMGLHRAIAERDYKKIEDILVADGFYYLKEFEKDAYIYCAKNRINDSLHKSLREVNPDFFYPARNWEWEFPNLLSAMYLMTYLDFKVGNMPIKCKKEKCSVYFVPGRGNKVYCSKKCRSDDNMYSYREEGKRIDSDRDKEGRTPLMRSIMKKDIGEFERLIKKGIHLNRRDKKGMTALHYAVQYGDKNMIMIYDLLNKKTSKININKKDNHGNTALDLATELNKKDICQLLKEHMDSRKKDKHKKRKNSVTA